MILKATLIYPNEDERLCHVVPDSELRSIAGSYAANMAQNAH